MPDNKPTHDQAQLQLQLYDLRREAKLRQAREWFTQNYFVDSMEDSNRIAPPGSQEGTYVMMVLTYWDQACALLNRRLLQEQLFSRPLERPKATLSARFSDSGGSPNLLAGNLHL
jgi:hypothetical protein